MVSVSCNSSVEIVCWRDWQGLGRSRLCYAPLMEVGDVWAAVSADIIWNDHRWRAAISKVPYVQLSNYVRS